MVATQKMNNRMAKKNASTTADKKTSKRTPSMTQAVGTVIEQNATLRSTLQQLEKQFADAYQQLGVLSQFDRDLTAPDINIHSCQLPF